VRIARRFGLLVSVLVVFAVAFAGVIFYETGGQMVAADRLRDLVAVAGDAGVVGQQLQQERAAAAAVLIGGGSDQLDRFTRQVESTSVETQHFRTLRGGLSSVPAGTAVVLERIDGELAGLAGLREQVRSGRAVSLSAVMFAYRIVIADLVAYRDGVAQAGGAPPDLADRIRAGVALSRAAENVALEQVTVLATVAPGVQVTPAIQQDFAATRTGYVEAISSFAGLAPPEWQSWLAHGLTGPDIVAAQRLEDQVSRVPLGERVRLDTGAWVAAMSARSDRLHRVEADADAAVRASIDRLREVRRTQTLGTAGGVLFVVLAAVGLAVAMGRPLVRRLRRLRDTAQWVAEQGLPQAVAALRETRVGSVDPAEYAVGQTQVAAGDGHDEVAEVGRAFNAVYQTAVRTAAQELILRQASAENLVHLSRRGQSLLDLLIRLLDTVERDETNPERMDTLWRLDSAVTQVRRVNLSLLLLGGAGVSVPGRGDIAVFDVLRGAQSQIESYQRVDLGSDQTGAAVMGSAVDEVVHLFAELLDNATRYSGPHAPVQVEVRADAGTVIVEIADQGRLSEDTREKLNRRLAAAGDAHLASMRSLGLAAVGMIAARYGIGVHLRGGAGLGTVAEVRLPHTILRTVPAPLGGLAVGAAGGRHAAGPAVPDAATHGGSEPARPKAVDEPTQTLEPVSGAPAPRPRVEALIFQELAAAFSFTTAGEGWLAADRAAAPVATVTTASGLPVRERGQHLVPGSLTPSAPAGAPQAPRRRRDPYRSSAAAAAYGRGLMRGRTRVVPHAGIHVEHVEQGKPR
jgi:signal transduction histidine kinase